MIPAAHSEPRRAASVVTILIAAVVCSSASARSTPGTFSYTHAVTVSGKFVDSWNRTATGDCGLQGSGATTSTFSWAGAWKVRPEINPNAGAHGQWVLTIKLSDLRHPVPASAFAHPLATPAKTILVTALPSRPTDATTTWTDGAVPQGTDCTPPDKSGCVTRQQSTKSDLTGISRSALVFTAALRLRPSGGCDVGTSDNFQTGRVRGRGSAHGLVVHMPSARSLRRKTLVVSASDSNHGTFDEGLDQLDETVTRSLTVTFKRLK